MLKCHYCNYTSNRSFNMRRHEKCKHINQNLKLSNPMTNIYIPDGRTFKKIRTVGGYDNIKLINPGFNKIDKTSDGIIFNNMGNNNNTGQTTKVNTHLVNFGQHYPFEPSNIPMNKLKMDNLSKQSMKNNEASTNTNLTNNTFTQTQPIEYYEAGVNTIWLIIDSHKRMKERLTCNR